MSIQDNPTLEKQRDLERKKSGRVAYDCFNLKQTADERVYCAKGYPLAGGLLEILKGVTPKVCKTCDDYDGGE